LGVTGDREIIVDAMGRPQVVERDRFSFSESLHEEEQSLYKNLRGGKRDIFEDRIITPGRGQPSGKSIRASNPTIVM